MNKVVELPPPADKIVADFITKISAIEPNFIDGVYLTGSLPLNDFYSNKSDIDFIVLCKTLPDKKAMTQLHHIHKEIAKRYPKPDLSGSYITSVSILTSQPDNINSLSFHEGKMRYRKFNMAPVSLFELKSNAITIFGQQAEILPIEIDSSYLKRFLYNNINSYWVKWINAHSSWFNRKLLLLCFPRFTEWSVLGVARQFFTLQSGKIVSKTQAGIYCLQHLPVEFHPIIKEALEIRKDNRSYPIVKSYGIRPSFKRVTQTIACLSYMITAFNGIYKVTGE